MDINKRIEILRKILERSSGFEDLDFIQEMLEFSTLKELKKWLYQINITGFQINNERNQLVIQQAQSEIDEALAEMEKLYNKLEEQTVSTNSNKFPKQEGKALQERNFRLIPSVNQDIPLPSNLAPPSSQVWNTEEARFRYLQQEIDRKYHQKTQQRALRIKSQQQVTYKGINLLREEVDVLKHLEQSLKTAIPNTRAVLPNTLGFSVQDDIIVGLSLSKQGLVSLPDNFGNLTNLEELYLGYNKLTSLPKSFYQLKDLLILDLCNNLFKSLPESFSQLSNLKEVNIGVNPLQSLPASLKDLHHLKIIQLWGIHSLKDPFNVLGELKRQGCIINR